MGLLQHLKTELAFAVMRLPMKGQWRPLWARAGGVEFSGKNQYIGRNVCFDATVPQKIHVGENVHITEGCTILAHYLDTKQSGVHWCYGDVVIDDYAFIVAHTIICKPCRIGKNSIVGAGSVVTRDIPDNEIWAGNPARFIKSRE